jgi:hypothetical protein
MTPAPYAAPTPMVAHPRERYMGQNPARAGETFFQYTTGAKKKNAITITTANAPRAILAFFRMPLY